MRAAGETQIPSDTIAQASTLLKISSIVESPMDTHASPD
jgi:hypothetical protein